MEEIKVGEYVRTKEGFIFQIAKEHYHSFITTEKYNKKKYENYKGRYITDLKEFYVYLDIDEIRTLKHSFNIIDLIEVGDYVNGREVEETTRNGFITLKSFGDDNYGDFNILENEYIETIVTKEQFESMEYKVGGK